MRMLADDDDELITTATQKQTSQQPAWMRTLFERCREWLGLLPTVSFTVIQE
jgi:dynein heavy chain 1